MEFKKSHSKLWGTKQENEDAGRSQPPAAIKTCPNKMMRAILFPFILVAIMFMAVPDCNAGDIRYLYFSVSQEDEIDFERYIIQELTFINGEFVWQRDVLVSSDLSLYTGQKYKIINNRFLVTGSGEIIDLAKDTILFIPTGNCHFLAVDNDTAYYCARVRCDKDGMKIKRQIYKYAIGENQKLELEENRQSYWYIIMEADELHRPVFSPNKRYYAYASGLREIYLHDMANKDERLLVKDCAARVDFKSSHLPEIPICWLDDSTVLTQRDNGEIIAVNLEGVVVGQLSFGAPKAPKDNPCFYTLADGTILYYCEDFYVIDMDKKVAREWDWKSFGYGFEMDISMDPYNRYQKIKYYGEIIGVLPCSSLNYAATDGFLALDLWPYDSFKRGLAIWNSITGKWMNLEIAQLEGILGWRVADEQE